MKPKDYLGVVRHNARKIINDALLDDLRFDGIGQDFLQEQKLLALEAEKHGLDLRETSNFAQRGIYKALVNYGYFRPKHSKGFLRRAMDEEQNEEQG